MFTKYIFNEKIIITDYSFAHSIFLLWNTIEHISITAEPKHIYILLTLIALMAVQTASYKIINKTTAITWFCFALGNL